LSGLDVWVFLRLSANWGVEVEWCSSASRQYDLFLEILPKMVSYFYIRLLFFCNLDVFSKTNRIPNLKP